MKRKPTRSAPQLPTSYSRAAVIFVCLALISVVLIAYLSLGRTIITITPQLQSQDVQITLLVKAPDAPAAVNPDDQSAISGRILSTTVSGSDQFQTQGTGELQPAQAAGQVTIYNKWNQVQPLAATTRFLSASGVLFRLKERADVPPGGQVAAEVYADLPGAAGNIGPSHFTLPGLWPGLQDKIYAESSQAMTGGLKNLKIVAESDLADAQAALQATLLAEAKQEFNKILTEADTPLALAEATLSPTVAKQSHSVEVGAEADSFESALTLKVSAVALAPTALTQAIQARLGNSVPEYFQLVSGSTDEPAVSIDRLNEDAETAELTVNSGVVTSVTADHPMFDKSTLTNKDRQSIQDYFADFPEVKNVDVRFSPFWTFRSSSLPDHIEVRLADPV